MLPEPVALPGPPGSPRSRLVVLEDLSSVAFAAGTVVHLLEPAAVLHGWQGADAAVAGAEVAAATGVAEHLHAALTAAVAALSSHAETWQLVERRLDELRRQQEQQFADALPRLARAAGPLDLGGTVLPPEAAALLHEVAAVESARAAEHRALLAGLTEDAERTAGLLGAATAPFGGTGRPGERVG